MKGGEGAESISESEKSDVPNSKKRNAVRTTAGRTGRRSETTRDKEGQTENGEIVANKRQGENDG